MKGITRIFWQIALFALLFTVSGCEKMSDGDLLTSHVWKWDKMTTDSTNEDVISIVAFSNALMTGGVFTFRSDGTYNLTVSAFTYSEDGTWELVGDDILMLDDDEMQIVKLDKEQLVLQGDEVTDEYGTYSYKMYMKK
ncbi:MAG: lipocalin family protein [Bacteroidales bacterium]|nr:lipocalin family protein [Bacteroidales bacterium]